MVVPTVLITLAFAAVVAGFAGGLFFSRPAGLSVFGFALASAGAAFVLVSPSLLGAIPLGALLLLAGFGALASIGGEH